MNIEDIRKFLCNLADDFSERGIQLRSVRFQYNADGHCTNAILSYDELEKK